MISKCVNKCANLIDLFTLWRAKPATIQTYYDKSSKQDIPVTIDHSHVFISDSPVCPEVWNDRTTGPKIAFILKEAYGETKDWSLTDWIRETQPACNIWYRVTEETYGLLNTTAERIARYAPDRISFEGSKEHPNVWLQQIAIVNLKKSGGKNSSNYGEIRAYAAADREEIIRELELLDPDVIVCGSTADALNSICGFKGLEKCDNWYYYSDAIGSRERFFIDYYHPVSRFPTLINYYGLMSIYQQALIEKEQL